MSYTLTWNGNNLPKAKIDGVDVQPVKVGSTHRTPDATLRASVLGKAAVIRLTWENRSSSDRSTLKGYWDALYNQDAKTLVLPNGDSYSVLPMTYQERAKHFGASAIRYDITMTFEEQ